jgi:hypothetical protein
MFEKLSMAKLRTKSILIGVLLCTMIPAAIAGPVATTNPQPKGDLSNWEQRLLGQDYSHDPPDKRIQRLELLLFGSTQEGSLTDRLTALRSAISSRPTMPVARNASAESVNQLEQRVLKKTFAADKLDVRLGRLETKLFGKASPSMPAPDRIDRLKRTIGIGEPPPIAQYPDSMPFNRMPINRMPFNNMPDFGGAMPFGGTGMPEDVTRQMNEMFKQLNDQLRALPRVPRTTPMPMPDSGTPQFREFRITPGHGLEETSPFKVSPMTPKSGDDGAIPPYADTNSI